VSDALLPASFADRGPPAIGPPLESGVIGADLVALVASAIALGTLGRFGLRASRDACESEEQKRWREFEHAFRRHVAETSGEREP
jgi:hypothetical protein